MFGGFGCGFFVCLFVCFFVLGFLFVCLIACASFGKKNTKKQTLNSDVPGALVKVCKHILHKITKEGSFVLLSFCETLVRHVFASPFLISLFWGFATHAFVMLAFLLKIRVNYFPYS